MLSGSILGALAMTTAAYTAAIRTSARTARSSILTILFARDGFLPEDFFLPLLPAVLLFAEVSEAVSLCVRCCSYLTKLHRLSGYKNIVYFIIFKGEFKGFSCKLPKTALKCKEFHALYECAGEI